MGDMLVNENTINQLSDDFDYARDGVPTLHNYTGDFDPTPYQNRMREKLIEVEEKKRALMKKTWDMRRKLQLLEEMRVLSDLREYLFDGQKEENA